MISFALILAMAVGLITPALAADNSFSDVPSDAWYSEAVDYVQRSGLMAGTGADTFSPNTHTSRAMLVTVLWRLAEEPMAAAPASFDDTSANTWYSNALSWAVEQGSSPGTATANSAPTTL